MRSRIATVAPTCVMLLFQASSHAAPLTLKEWVGKQIFLDANLSINRNQSCAVCHSQTVGFTGDDAAINLGGAVYEGSIPGAFGNRKTPSSAYASYAPRLRYDKTHGGFVGGNFWDGRATGWKVGNPAADQAQGPFLNPVEQALPSASSVVERVCSAAYAASFLLVWGGAACHEVDPAYDYIALSISAYEGSQEMSPFSSKYDAYLAGKTTLTAKESLGLALFNGKAKCSGCHPSARGADGSPPLFTDFTYDNLGVPKNPANPVYAGNPDFIDSGLGGFVRTLAESSDWRKQPFVSPSIARLSDDELAKLAVQSVGKQRVPTLRNVAKGIDQPKAFTHNGYFKTLKGIVHYYNTRDTLKNPCSADTNEAHALLGNCWPPPEVTQNLNTREIGALGLSAAEEDAIVAFLETLSDGYGS